LHYIYQLENSNLDCFGFMKPFIRKHELAQLEAFAGSGKAELMYLRGRRRVGKSWLLQDFANSDPGSRFLFAGASDISAPNLLKSFINRWAAFSGLRPIPLVGRIHESCLQEGGV
jgi:AAA+ ATPase superfamily predicted ATPase